MKVNVKDINIGIAFYYSVGEYRRVPLLKKNKYITIKGRPFFRLTKLTLPLFKCSCQCREAHFAGLFLSARRAAASIGKKRWA